MQEVKPYPPKLFLRFFRWYCHPRLSDHIEGDLIEVYRKRVHKNGKRNADIACLIAIPIAYYLLAEWLKQYEYRTEISWWIFVVTSLATLVITLVTVSYQAVKAAMMKPVKSLRSE